MHYIYGCTVLCIYGSVSPSLSGSRYSCFCSLYTIENQRDPTFYTKAFFGRAREDPGGQVCALYIRHFFEQRLLTVVRGEGAPR